MSKMFEDFFLLRLPVRTNLLITSLMWASNDVSWICKSGYLARYSYLQTVTKCSHSSVYESLITITRHNNASVLFNRINHFHDLRFLAQKQNFRMQAPRVLKTTVLLFWAWINENYCSSHLKNVKTIKTMTLNDKLQMTLMTSENEVEFLKSMVK